MSTSNPAGNVALRWLWWFGILIAALLVTGIGVGWMLGDLNGWLFAAAVALYLVPAWVAEYRYQHGRGGWAR